MDEFRKKEKTTVCLFWYIYINVVKFYLRKNWFRRNNWIGIERDRERNKSFGRKRKINTRNEKIQKGRERRNTRLARSLVGLLMPGWRGPHPAQTPCTHRCSSRPTASATLFLDHIFVIKSPRRNPPVDTQPMVGKFYRIFSSAALEFFYYMLSCSVKNLQSSDPAKNVCRKEKNIYM